MKDSALDRSVQCEIACNGVPTEQLRDGLLAEAIQALQFYGKGDNWRALIVENLETFNTMTLLELDQGQRARYVLGKLADDS